MKNFKNKRLSVVEARQINGTATCGYTTRNKKYYTVHGRLDCRDAQFNFCNHVLPDKDICGARDYYRNTGKTDITCYWDEFACSGSLIWC